MHRHLHATLVASLGITLIACGDDSDIIEPIPPLEVQAVTLPGATQGEYFFAEITASGGSSPDNFRWSLAPGSLLPTGLKHNSQGVPLIIDGVPAPGSTGGTFTFVLRDPVSDQQTEATFTIDVTPQPPGVAISTMMLPQGFLTMVYEAEVEAENGTAYTWSVRSGSLPPGLEIERTGNPARITGMPAQRGSFSFTLEVVDAGGTSAQRQFRIEVEDDTPPLTIPEATFPEARVDQPFRAELLARGGTGRGYRWRLVSGALPAGVEFSEEGTPNTTFQGTPTESGIFTFRMEVRDSANVGARASFFIAVEPPPPPLRILTFTLPRGRAGEAYDVPLRGQGGTSMGYQWTLDDLVQVVDGERTPVAQIGGLSVVQGTPDGRLQGTPAVSGRFEMVLRLEDSFGLVSTQPVSLVLDEAITPVEIDATGAVMGVLELAPATLGSTYTAILVANGGAPLPANAGASEHRYGWVVTSGTLPPGLQLEPRYRDMMGREGGRIIGVPTSAGSFDATITVFDRLDRTDDQPIRIVVSPPAGT